jgi:hypothetical protein
MWLESGEARKIAAFAISCEWAILLPKGIVLVIFFILGY